MGARNVLEGSEPVEHGFCSWRASPADQRGAPGEAAAHRLDHHEIAGLDAAVLDRDARASGIEAAEVLPCLSTVTTTFSRANAKLVGGGVDDAPVGLMRHEPVDVVRRSPASAKQPWITSVTMPTA